MYTSPEDIESAARQHGITMQALYQEAGKAHSVFARWRNGASPRLETVKAFNDALDRLIAK